MRPLSAVLLACLPGACAGDPAAVDDPGANVYGANCVTCHQVDGRGVAGVYPPLVASEWANADEGRLIRLVLNGMRGRHVAGGVEYDNVMTPHSFLSDDQIAAVLNYVRTHFGNSADSVRAGDVAAVRAALEPRGLWTSEELATQTGIPGR